MQRPSRRATATHARSASRAPSCAGATTATASSAIRVCTAPTCRSPSPESDPTTRPTTPVWRSLCVGRRGGAGSPAAAVRARGASDMGGANDSRLAGGDHAVAFYAHDDELVDVAERLLADALRGGDAAIAIASAPHRMAIRECLTARGVDVEGALRDGRLVMQDAAELLGSIMLDG